ncbi:MAG: hypothetical protein ACRCYF_10145, partial [Shewanella sp.]
ETAQATSQVRHPIQRLGSAITKLFIERDPKWFVTPGRPPTGKEAASLPQSIYQTKTGEWRDKKSQATENKGVISKSSVLFTATDEGDDGVGSVIDTTKVTSSTPADQPLPQPCCGDVQRGLQPGSAAPNRASGGRNTVEKNHTKGQKWAVQHAKAACSDDKLFGFAIELASHH